MNARLTGITVLKIYGIPLTIISISLFLALSKIVVVDSMLATGIIYDLTLTTPIVYLLLIWNRDIPKITAVPFFIAGLILASFVIPEQHDFHLDLMINFVLPLVELTVLGFIIYNVRQGVKEFKSISNTGLDFFSQLKVASYKVIGNRIAATAFSTEVAMFYYAFFSWKVRKRGGNEFSGYKENGVIALLGVVIFLLIAETVIVHILLIRWNELVAWIILGLSIYSGIQLFAHIKALTQRPHAYDENYLYLRYGLFGGARINLENIKNIEITNKEKVPEDKHIQKLSLLGNLEEHNVAVHLKEPDYIEKAYGIRKECSTILLFVDEPDRFKSELINLIG